MRFLEPHNYIRMFDLKTKRFRYLLLLEREGPIEYPYTFADVAAGASKSDMKSFEDLNPARHHILQVFIGLRPGYRMYLWHPYDERMLKHDEATLDDIDSDSVCLDSRSSPYEDPQYSIWIQRDKYPGIEVKNTLNYTSRPRIRFVTAKFNYMEISDPTLLDKLNKHIIRAEPVAMAKID